MCSSTSLNIQTYLGLLRVTHIMRGLPALLNVFSLTWGSLILLATIVTVCQSVVHSSVSILDIRVAICQLQIHP